MNNSFAFFANKDCEYYPCHKNIDEVNCLFCYCPLYNITDCPGNYTFIEKNGRTIKSCLDCTFPHKRENYPAIIKILRENIWTWCKLFYYKFDYEKEREISDFYLGTAFPLSQCERICVNFVLACLSSGLPYPLLYLLLRDKKINLTSDDNIYFSYYFDLTDFNADINEAECVLLAAMLIKDLLEKHEEEKSISYKLINRKIKREGYKKFSELYKDIKLSASGDQKKGIIAAIKRFLHRHEDGLKRACMTICTVLIIVMLLSFLSERISGDNIFRRLFTNTFTTIGTESMLQ